MPPPNRLPHRGRMRLIPRAGANAEFRPLAETYPLGFIFSKLSKLRIYRNTLALSKRSYRNALIISKHPCLIETPLGYRHPLSYRYTYILLELLWKLSLILTRVRVLFFLDHWNCCRMTKTYLMIISY